MTPWLLFERKTQNKSDLIPLLKLIKIRFILIITKPVSKFGINQSKTWRKLKETQKIKNSNSKTESNNILSSMKFLIQYKKYNDIIFSENPIEFLSPSKWHGSKNEWLHFSKCSKKCFQLKISFAHCYLVWFKSWKKLGKRSHSDNLAPVSHPGFLKLTESR